MHFLEILESELQKFQITLDRGQTATLALYCDELARWNKKINLTSLTGVDLVRRLVVEPVWIGLQLRQSGVLVDIGSGNGSPAIPLHVACRFTKCHLVEARAKRAVFLRHLAAQLKLGGAEIHRGRFEDVATHLEVPDWITLQAVALTTELLGCIRKLAGPETTLAWITSTGPISPAPPSRVIMVPTSRTTVFVFEHVARVKPGPADGAFEGKTTV